MASENLVLFMFVISVAIGFAIGLMLTWHLYLTVTNQVLAELVWLLLRLQFLLMLPLLPLLLWQPLPLWLLLRLQFVLLLQPLQLLLQPLQPLLLLLLLQPLPLLLLLLLLLLPLLLLPLLLLLLCTPGFGICLRYLTGLVFAAPQTVLHDYFRTRARWQEQAPWPLPQ